MNLLIRFGRLVKVIESHAPLEQGVVAWGFLVLLAGMIAAIICNQVGQILWVHVTAIDLQQLHLRMEPLFWTSNIAATIGMLVFGMIVIHMIRCCVPYTILVYQIIREIEHVCQENHEVILDEVGWHFAKQSLPTPQEHQRFYASGQEQGKDDQE